jgi:hypothetical protein
VHDQAKLTVAVITASHDLGPGVAMIERNSVT